MSRWPPEIAGTISHPAGRSAVTAERVPIFYSARSSSPSFSSAHRILPFSLSLSLFSFPPCPPLAPSPSPYAQRSQCVGPIQRLDENGPEPFPPQKEGRKGWQKMAGSTKESRCPDNPDLSTLPPILSFFFSFLLLLPRAHPLRHLLFSRRIFPYRIGMAVWVGCVCGLLLHSSQKSEEHPLN